MRRASRINWGAATLAPLPHLRGKGRLLDPLDLEADPAGVRAIFLEKVPVVGKSRAAVGAQVVGEVIKPHLPFP